MPKSVSIPDTAEDAEEFYLMLCEIIPEDRLRHEVELLPRQGYDLKTLDDFRALFRLSSIFDVTVTTMLVRLLQVYPDLKKRLAL
jgi:hypothetical protein